MSGTTLQAKFRVLQSCRLPGTPDSERGLILSVVPYHQVVYLPYVLSLTEFQRTVGL